jgi:hypothetical protein
MGLLEAEELQENPGLKKSFRVHDNSSPNRRTSFRGAILDPVELSGAFALLRKTSRR